MKVAKETWIILAIGIADLISTIVFIRHHGAHEANPLFRHYWEMGLFAFVCAKMAMLAAPLFVLEWARRRSPAFVSLALRTAIAGYVLMYGIGYLRLNARVQSTEVAEAAPFEADPAIVSFWHRTHHHNP